MSQRSKRQMALSSHLDGPAHAYQTGSAPAAVPTPGGQLAWWPGPLAQATPSAATSQIRNQNDKKRSKGKTVINLEDGNDVRTAKRLVFDPDEDERLVSAWLIHSNDPINGNCKKNEMYWGDVHELYNETTPTNRKRERYAVAVLDLPPADRRRRPSGSPCSIRRSWGALTGITMWLHQLQVLHLAAAP